MRLIIVPTGSSSTTADVRLRRTVSSREADSRSARTFSLLTVSSSNRRMLKLAIPRPMRITSSMLAMAQRRSKSIGGVRRRTRLASAVRRVAPGPAPPSNMEQPPKGTMRPSSDVPWKFRTRDRDADVQGTIDGWALVRRTVGAGLAPRPSSRPCGVGRRVTRSGAVRWRRRAASKGRPYDVHRRFVVHPRRACIPLVALRNGRMANVARRIGPISQT